MYTKQGGKKMATKQENWGGARSGAGRKKNNLFATVAIRIPDNLLTFIQLLKDENKKELITPAIIERLNATLDNEYQQTTALGDAELAEQASFIARLTKENSELKESLKELSDLKQDNAALKEQLKQVLVKEDVKTPPVRASSLKKGDVIVNTEGRQFEFLVLYKRSASRKAYIECKALSGNIKGETVTIEAVALKKYHFIGKG